MALTNDKSLANRMALLRSHGVTRDAGLMTQEADGPWYYQQIDLGFNYRMTDIQAALGLSQLERLNAYVRRRHQLAGRYDELLADLPVAIPWRDRKGYSSFHLYVVRLLLDQCAARHRRVFEAMRAQEVGVNLHYIPIHTQPYYSNMGFETGAFPEAERYYREAISLPLYPGLTFSQQDEIVTTLKSALAS